VTGNQEVGIAGAGNPANLLNLADILSIDTLTLPCLDQLELLGVVNVLVIRDVLDRPLVLSITDIIEIDFEELQQLGGHRLGNWEQVGLIALAVSL